MRTRNSQWLRVLASLVCLSFAASACAQTTGTHSNWDRVRRLKPDTPIRVIRVDHTSVEGRFVSADDQLLRINAEAGAGVLSPREVPRDAIQRVTRMKGRGSKTRALLIGMAAGTAAGIAAGAAYDSAKPSAEDPGQGKLIFGVVGFFVGPAVALTIQRLRGEALIYERP